MRRYGLTKFLAVAAVGLATLLASAPRAEAGFTIVLSSVVFNAGTNDYTWTYNAQTTADDVIVGGQSFFRVYDFYGYVAGSISGPANWSGATALSNPTPPPDVIIGLGDDPTIPNLIFSYNAGAASIVGPTTVFGFSARSIYGQSRNKNFVGRTQNTTTATNVDSVGITQVPVPEPASVISTSLGVIALGLFYARRRKSAV